MYAYDGNNLMPGMRTPIVEATAELIWKNGYLVFADDFIISSAASDAGNTGYTTTLRAGLLMGKVTSTGEIKEWNPTGTDGSQNIIGILGRTVSTALLGSTADKWHYPTLVRGPILDNQIVVPGATDRGISSSAYLYEIKRQLLESGLFIFESDPAFSVARWPFRQTKTADYTVTTDDHRTVFDNTGDAGAITFTLPATPLMGLRFAFHCVVDQTMTITAEANEMISFNDVASTSIAFSTAGNKVGAYVEVVGDGTSWRAVSFGPHTVTST